MTAQINAYFKSTMVHGYSSPYSSGDFRKWLYGAHRLTQMHRQEGYSSLWNIGIDNIKASRVVIIDNCLFRNNGRLFAYKDDCVQSTLKSDGGIMVCGCISESGNYNNYWLPAVCVWKLCNSLERGSSSECLLPGIEGDYIFQQDNASSIPLRHIHKELGEGK